MELKSGLFNLQTSIHNIFTHVLCHIHLVEYIEAVSTATKGNILSTRKHIHLSRRADTSMSSGYRPEGDTWVQLEGTDHTYFQELIGILRWATELGRIDIMLEVSRLSTHLAMPRNGHLEQNIHKFAYLKAHPKKILAMDPQHHVYNENQFSPV
jgi:hypothetical protein